MMFISSLLAASSSAKEGTSPTALMTEGSPMQEEKKTKKGSPIILQEKEVKVAIVCIVVAILMMVMMPSSLGSKTVLPFKQPPTYYRLTPEQIKMFQNDGVLHLKDIFTSYTKEMEEIKCILDNTPPWTCQYQTYLYNFIVTKVKNATNFGKHVNMMCADAGYMFRQVEKICFESAIGSIAYQLLKPISGTIRLEHTDVMSFDTPPPPTPTTTMEWW